MKKYLNVAIHPKPKYINYINKCIFYFRMPKKFMTQPGTMQYYRDIESYNTKLRGRLLARTKIKKGETSQEWSQRVYAMYEKKRKKAN